MFTYYFVLKLITAWWNSKKENIDKQNELGFPVEVLYEIKIRYFFIVKYSSKLKNHSNASGNIKVQKHNDSLFFNQVGAHSHNVLNEAANYWFNHDDLYILLRFISSVENPMRKQNANYF